MVEGLTFSNPIVTFHNIFYLPFAGFVTPVKRIQK